MQRMISPELFQIRGCTNYDESLAEVINGCTNGKTISHSHSDRANSSSDSNENSVLLDTARQADEILDNEVIRSGSLGTISNYSARRQGTTIPPTLEALDKLEKTGELSTTMCECNHREEIRRKSTGSYEEKYYFVGGGNLVSENDEYSGEVSWHGKYSFVADDNHVTKALQCCRYKMRRNALCDPFRLPMPQKTREKLEKENERRKSSVARKVSQFLTVALDLDREEDLF